jgi:quinol-cytochrome oxidoreductase complex cytochrome b subunit
MVSFRGNTAFPPMQEMTPYQRSHCIIAMPSLLEFFSYVFAFGNLLAGPVIEYRDYQDFINLKGLWDPKAAKPVPTWGCYKRVRADCLGAAMRSTLLAWLHDTSSKDILVGSELGT